jgi:hypothetical protein
MEPQVSLPFSQLPSVFRCPELDERSISRHILFLKPILMLLSYLHLGLPSSLFHPDLQAKYFLSLPRVPLALSSMFIAAFSSTSDVKTTGHAIMFIDWNVHVMYYIWT